MVKGEYRIIKGTSAKGSKYAPLQSDGIDYLCPECGGYGTVYNKCCTYCLGKGVISLTDTRVKKS